jgi:hypothetical protein
MTGGSHSQGVFSSVLFEPGATPHTFDANSEAYEYLSHNIRRRGRLGGHHGIRGTRSRPNVRVRELASYFYGTMHMYISPGDFVTLLPKMIGDSVSSQTFSLAEDIPYFGMLCDEDYGVFQYKDCKVDKWVVRSRAPELNEEGDPDILELALTIIASDEDPSATWPGTPPTIGTAATKDSPYVVSDCDGQVTMQGSVRAIEEFALGGNNYCYARYVNALRPHSIKPRDREISFACRVPWVVGNVDLYNQAAAGAVASIKFINGTVSTLFTFAKLHVPPQGPAPERGKHEISLELNGFATATGLTDSTRELQIVNDSTV